MLQRVGAQGFPIARLTPPNPLNYHTRLLHFSDQVSGNFVDPNPDTPKPPSEYCTRLDAVALTLPPGRSSYYSLTAAGFPFDPTD